MPPDATELLYSALYSSHGLLVRTRGGFVHARTELYKVRKSLGDPRLHVLEFRASALDGGNLAIVKRGPKAPKEAP